MQAHQYHTLVRAELAVLSVSAEGLRVLLCGETVVADQGWALPNRPVQPEQDLEAAARAELADRLGFCDTYVEQLYTFSPQREAPNSRAIKVAYLVLIGADRAEGASPRMSRWFSCGALPPLSPEPKGVLALARQRLADKLCYSTIAFQLMAKEFTLSELQCAHEMILDKRLDKRNFRRRMLALDRLIETGEKSRHGAHRPARLYRLRHPERVEVIK